MEILVYIWEHILFIPLFNLLIWLYVNYSWFNFGVSVIILTVLLRLALLPLTILDEVGKFRWLKIEPQLQQINEDFAKDPVRRKIATRQLFRKHHLRPWAKAVVLAVQLLALILLYQVFLGGINSTKLNLLYPSIPAPDFIGTKFLWFDIAKHDFWIAGVAAAYFFIDAIFRRWDRQHSLSKQEQVYIIFFPAFLFLILVLLPSVKSLFVLTSMIISTIISMFMAMIQLALRPPKKAEHGHH
jgi:YidC/Oxa1 family membrane protein insertase